MPDQPQTPASKAYGDVRHSTIAEMLENTHRVAAMTKAIEHYFGKGSPAFAWWVSDDNRIADLRDRGIWSADDEALCRYLLAVWRAEQKKQAKKA